MKKVEKHKKKPFQTSILVISIPALFRFTTEKANWEGFLLNDKPFGWKNVILGCLSGFFNVELIVDNIIICFEDSD